jgi:RNA polymerase sigma-70 factor (ECF subfamily)
VNMAKAVLSEATVVAQPSTVAAGKLEILANVAPSSADSGVSPCTHAAECIDQPSFEQLFRRFAPYVLHALPYLGVAESDVEDLCQDVFATVYQNLSKFQGRSSIRTWIYGICLNKVLNYRRAAFRHRERLEASSEQGIESHQLAQLEQKQTRFILQRALGDLASDKREVFVLYEIEELPMSEVAQALGCPLFTAYSRLYAARRDIKNAVERLMADDGQTSRSTRP